jgi:hypothetical protein
MDAEQSGPDRRVVGRGLIALAAIIVLASAALLVAIAVGGAPPLSTGAPTTTTVYAVGDIAGEGGGAAAVAEMIGRHNFDALLTLGDHAYETGSLYEFESLYAPTFGAFDDRVYPSPGNHDYETEGAAGYFTYFGEQARNFPDRAYYAFTLGAWRIYSLNSEIDESMPGSAMYEWLRNDLSRSTSPCVAAYWHKPVFTVGRKENDEGSMRLVWELLAARGADLVLTGHDHNYQRWAPIDGITSFIVGTGGRSRYPIERADDRLAYANDGTYGALRLDLEQDGAQYAFHSDDDEVLDSGELACRPKNAAVTPAPQEPLEVTTTTEGAEVTLAWQPGQPTSDEIIGYLVFRGTDLVGFTNELAFVDTGLPPGSSVLYTVRAVDSFGGRSPPSSPVHAGGEILGYTDYAWTGLDENPSSPTADKPQSKLWYADGSWWGILYATEANGAPAPAYYIERFDPAAQGWHSTWVAVDERARSHADVLWWPDTQKLYVASTTASGAAKLYRYSFADGSYSLDEGYPVRVTETGSESITIAMDSTGVLWMTMTQVPDGSGPCVEAQPCTVRFLHSTDRDFRWTPSTALPVEGAVVKPDDISAVVAYGNDRIGVVWSNQLVGGFLLATHADGEPDTSWTAETINVAPRASDDHINVKADAAGRLYMVVKTSLNDEANGDPEAPLIAVWVRELDGRWRTATVWQTRDDVTRPQILVDEKLARILVVGAQPATGGAIVYKTAALGDLRFEEGIGTPILAAGRINNPTTTKQTISLSDGTLILAGDSPSRVYWHAIVRLEDAP